MGETADEENKEDEEDVLDVGDGVDGGEEEEAGEGEPELRTEVDIEADNEEEDKEVIVGNGLVEEVAAEIEGSWTRRGRRYDGGGHL